MVAAARYVDGIDPDWTDPVPDAPDNYWDTPPDPRSERALHDWLFTRLGLNLSRESVCPGHTSPYEIALHKYRHKPTTSIVHGPRGGGKSMIAGVMAHLYCRFNAGYRVKILGGSKQQSAQAYEAIADRVVAPARAAGDAVAIDRLLKESVVYHNRSAISILAASRLSVRGPHVPHLILDEVDEQDPDIMGSAIGIVQEYADKGFLPTLEYLSTWHRVGGLMESKMEQAREHGHPIFHFCIFEVLSKCPESISGRDLEKCPDCPIFRYCWADRLDDPTKEPRAKRSSGHYTLRTVLDKVANLSAREFESDYLCIGPKVEGVWFRDYDDAGNVNPVLGEYDPRYKVYVSIDYGVRTAAVFFQIRPRQANGRMTDVVSVFAEHYAEGETPETNAASIRAVAAERCGGRMDDVSMDSAGKHREAAGTTGVAEYYRAGLPVRPWPTIGGKGRPKLDTLMLTASFIKSAAGVRQLYIHPRCTGLRTSLRQYRRAKMAGVYLDRPADPQHPEENFVDALTGGLVRRYPDGRGRWRNAGALHVPPTAIGG